MIYYTADGAQYQGMDQDTILALRQEMGKNTIWITKEEFDALPRTI